MVVDVCWATWFGTLFPPEGGSGKIMLPTWYKNVRKIYLAKETRCDGIIGIHNTNQVVYNDLQKKQCTLLLHIASYCHPLVLDVLVIEAFTRISKSPATFTLFHQRSVNPSSRHALSIAGNAWEGTGMMSAAVAMSKALLIQLLEDIFVGAIRCN